MGLPHGQSQNILVCPLKIVFYLDHCGRVILWTFSCQLLQLGMDTPKNWVRIILTT